MQVLGAVGTIDDALRVLDASPVDVILLDYDLGFQRGSELIDLVHRRGFLGRIAVLTAWLERNDVVTLLALGVTAIVLKVRPLEFVVQLVRSLGDGGSEWVDDRCRELLFAEAAVPSEPTEEGFSRRERDVLQMIVSGMMNKEIAEPTNLGNLCQGHHPAHVLQSRCAFAGTAHPCCTRTACRRDQS